MATLTDPLSREKMDEMMADYALNNLSPEEAKQFEESLSFYPDICVDVEKVRVAFAQFAKEDYIESRTRRARTLSVHVQERLATSQRRGNVRRLWPVFALGMVLLFMFAPGGFFFKEGTVIFSGSHGGGASTQEEFGLVTRDEVLQVLAAVDVDAVDVADALSDRTPMHSYGNDIVLDMPVGASLMSDDMIEEMAKDALYPMSDDALSGAWYADLRESDIQELFEDLDSYDIM